MWPVCLCVRFIPTLPHISNSALAKETDLFLRGQAKLFSSLARNWQKLILLSPKFILCKKQIKALITYGNNLLLLPAHCWKPQTNIC